MGNSNFNRHISGRFNIELESIRANVMAMGGLVERQITDALKAVHDQDVDLAKKIILKDQKVNEMEIAIDEACTRIIAKRQPAAGDLRLVIAIIKTITDLERIGDVANDIAKMTLENVSTHQEQPFLFSLESLGHKVAKMLNDTLNAFARMDVNAAIKVYLSDDLIDRDYEVIVHNQMMHMMESPRSVPNVLKVMWSVRALERVGDRCQNICEYIIYFVKGKDIRHTSKDQLESMLKQ